MAKHASLTAFIITAFIIIIILGNLIRDNHRSPSGHSFELEEDWEEIPVFKS